MKGSAFFALLTPMVTAGNYSVEVKAVDSAEVYVLRDATTSTEVWVAPSFGNNAYDMRVKGKRVLWAPEGRTLGDLMARPTLLGNPLLWPWANRLDREAFFFGGRKYTLNPALNNYRTDQHKQPIHGLLAYTKLWKPVQAVAETSQAVVKSRLEFWRYPELMAQFPFAHAVEMMYRLMDGVLEVETSIENLSIAAMPVSLGYHPYFQVNDAPRDEWKVTIPARNLVKLTATLVPSGELAANPHSKPVMLKGVTLDDVFTELVRNAAGFAVFSVEGQREKVAVEYGPGYPVAVVYAPPGRGFICFEPMTAVTNAINGAHAGWYKDLPVIGPGEVWRGVYRIRPSGF